MRFLPAALVLAAVLACAPTAAHAVPAPVDPSYRPRLVDGPGLRIEHVRPDGSVLLMSNDYNGTFDPNDDTWHLTQLGDDGRPDRSFSRDGLADLEDRQLVLFHDGTDIVTTRRVYTKELGWRSNVELRRLRGDGTFDPSWGTGGVSELWLIAPWDVDQATGRRDDEVCAGWSTPGGTALLVRDGNTTMNVLHLTDRGVPDTSIGTGGWVQAPRPAGLSLNGSSCVQWLALSGTRVLAQVSYASDERTTHGYVFDERTGVFDPSWGSDGVTLVGGKTSPDDWAFTTPVLQLSDGRLLASTRVSDISRVQMSEIGFEESGTTTVGIAMLRPDGSPDPAFGGGDGRIDVGTSSRNYDSITTPLVTVLRGRIVVVVAHGTGPVRSTMQRYLLDGTPDPEFGRKGQVTLGAPRAMDAELDRSGRLLVLETQPAPISNENTQPPPQLYRYRTDAGDVGISGRAAAARAGRVRANLVVRSSGPLASIGNRIQVDLPASVDRARGSVAGGTCSTRPSRSRVRVTCVVPRLLVGASASIRIDARADAGTIPLRATVDARTPDHRSTNDSVRLTLRAD